MAARSGFKRPLAYVYVPAAFAVLGYLVLWLVLQPVWGMARAAAMLLVANGTPNFDAALSSMYDQNAYERFAGQEHIPGSEVEFPLSGSQYGQLSCERIGLDAPVYWYDSNQILAQGVGQSLASFPPGFGRVIILAGHNTTYFKCLKDVAESDAIGFQTNYGKFEYRVTSVDVVDENDLETRLRALGRSQEEELVLYTCWPFEVISGRKTQRLVVTATKSLGPIVDWKDAA